MMMMNDYKSVQSKRSKSRDSSGKKKKWNFLISSLTIALS